MVPFPPTKLVPSLGRKGLSAAAEPRRGRTGGGGGDADAFPPPGRLGETSDAWSPSDASVGSAGITPCDAFAKGSWEAGDAGVGVGDSLPPPTPTPPLSLPPTPLFLLGRGTAFDRGQLAAFVAVSQEGRSVVCRSVYQLAFLCRSAAVFRGRLPPP